MDDTKNKRLVVYSDKPFANTSNRSAGRKSPGRNFTEFAVCCQILPRASGKQLALLSRLILKVGTGRYRAVKDLLNLTAMKAVDLSYADAERVIALLRKTRGRRL